MVVSNSTTTPPITILVGPPKSGASMNLTNKVRLESITIEETGNHEQATADFEILDLTLLYTVMRGEWKVIIKHGVSPVFYGFIRQPRSEIAAIYGERYVTAYDVGSLMDRIIIDPIASRAAGESDKSRIQWLFNTYGQPLTYEGYSDWSKVQVLEASMPAQKFGNNLTFRQALERILGAASNSANYYSDFIPRLHTFDNDHLETDAAPYVVNVTRAPAATEIAPEDLSIEWDTSNLVNYYYVRGKNAGGSGRFSDAPSIAIYGQRQAYIDAPDADTQIKAERVARAALRDTREPVVRGSFTVSGDSCGGSEATGAVLFDGATQYVSASGANLHPGDKFTVEFWFKRSSTQGATQTMYSAGAGDVKIAFTQVGDLLGVYRQDAGGVNFVSTASYTDTNWHHLVVARSPGSTLVYVDGSLIAGTDTARTFTAGATFNIGKRNGGTPEYFPGSMQHVAVYSTKFSAAQALAHYAAAATTYRQTVLTTSGLVSYWQFGETSGTSAVDEKGYADGTYVGSPLLGVIGAVGTGRKGNRWQGGQYLYVESDVHGLIGATPEPGRPSSWQALQPFRIVRVTTRYLNGTGDREMQVEFGGRRRHLYQAL